MKIFLDLDGTILDNKRKYYRIYTNLLSHGGFLSMEMDAYWDLKRNKISEEDIARHTTTPHFANYYASKRVELIETMDYLVLDSVFDEVYGVLEEWKKTHSIYIVTLRRNRENLNQQLDMFNLYHYYDFVYNMDERKARKEQIIKHEIDDPSNCMIIGDTGTDVIAGQRLGITTVAVTCGIRSRKLLEEVNPDFIFSDLKGVCEIL
jgi:phosphoglycolate phosphatase-like HAD superfamily hydrolase